MTPPSPIEISAPAKINLSLAVISKRPDGYHELETVMQKLQLADRLRLRPTTGPGVSLSCSGADLPEDESNLAFKAALRFFEHTGIKAGVAIELEKKIPVAAGLGGGSSDAGAVLLGLDRCFGSNLDEGALVRLAVELGADVPFFVTPSPAVLAGGIGERLVGIAPMRPCWLVLVNPGIAVSTRWAFDNLTLTSPANPYMLCRCLKSSGGGDDGAMPLLRGCDDYHHFFNDLEAVTIARHGVIEEIKRLLVDQGAQVALMSGSGPTVFAVFDRLDRARRSYSFFKDRYRGVFLTEPLR